MKKFVSFVSHFCNIFVQRKIPLVIIITDQKFVKYMMDLDRESMEK